MNEQEARALIADLTPAEKRLLYALLSALRSTPAEPPGATEPLALNDHQQMQSSERKYSGCVSTTI